MKQKIKKTGILCMTAAITLANSNMVCSAATVNTPKQENVFANLNEDGSVNGIYVVNGYQLTEDTQIVDYGTYSSIRNLTSSSLLENENGMITTEANKGNFFYQGNLESTDLPWDITITYYLDGAEIKASDLAGKSGALKMVIDVTENKAVKEAFFDNCMNRPERLKMLLPN